MSTSGYEKPSVEKFGTFRELTRMGFPFGSFGSNDLPGFNSQSGGGGGGDTGGSSAETGDPGGRS